MPKNQPTAIATHMKAASVHAQSGLRLTVHWSAWPKSMTGTMVSRANTTGCRQGSCSSVRWAHHRAGIEKLTPYELRHTAASLLSDQGQPMERVADLLGHDGVRMLSEVYRHAVTPTVDVAAEPMERLMRATKSERSAPHVAPSAGQDEAGHDDGQGDALATPGGP